MIFFLCSRYQITHDWNQWLGTSALEVSLGFSRIQRFRFHASLHKFAPLRCYFSTRIVFWIGGRVSYQLKVV